MIRILRFSGWKTYYKIVGSMLFVIIVLGGFLGLIMQETLVMLMGEQLDKRGREIADHVAALSADDILVENFYALSELLSQTKENNEDVRYILITSAEGKLLAHTFTEGIPQGLLDLRKHIAIDNQPSIVKFSTNEGIVRELVVPIEKGAVGFVRIGMSEKNMHMVISQKIGDVFIATVIVCIIACLMALRLSSFITKPIRNLVEAVQAIRKGCFDARAKFNGQDELGKLATAFNAMARNLQVYNAERNSLLDELQQKEQLQATLMTKLFSAQEDERKRISRELHDETSQSITSLIAYMRVIAEQTQDKKHKQVVLGARDVAVGILDNIRKLAVELRPPLIDDLGVIAAIRRYLDKYEQLYGIQTAFYTNDDRLIADDPIILALYRILQESLVNVAKHAAAQKVKVKIEHQGPTIKMVIADNGQGFGSGVLEEARKNNHLGVYGMRERAGLLGGTFSIQSEKRKGTVVTVVLPRKLG